MKTIYHINLIIYSITLLLYVSIYLFIHGLYAQVVLGFIQIVSATILLFSCNLYPKKIRTNLRVYWIVAIIDLLFVFYEPWRNLNETVTTFALYLIPMCLATYFIYINYVIQKIKNPFILSHGS